MKKVMVLLFAFIFILQGCNKTTNEKINDETESSKSESEEVEDTSKDKYGREYEDGNIVIRSDELRDMTIDFFTWFSVGDPKMLDCLYLDDAKKEGLRNLLSTDEGKKIVSKVANSVDFSSDGIPDAVFLKAEIDKDGNCFKNEMGTGITLSGPCYTNFINVLKAKNEEPFTDINEFSDYLDRFVEFYPAKNVEVDALDYCYYEGKPLIMGDKFLDYFGIFSDVNESTKTPLDLVKNGFLKSAEPDEDMKAILEPLSKSEYIKTYDLLREAKVNKDWDFDPNPTMKDLFQRPDEVRAKFLSDMRKLPNPLIKTYIEDGKKKTLVIYYYEDLFAPGATRVMIEDYFVMDSIENFSGVVFENIVSNTLAKQ